MISFISRVKNLSLTAEYVLVRNQKSETLGSRFCSSFQRTLCENNYLISNVLMCKQRNDSFNKKNYHHSENVPANFGKIVELDEDLNEIETKNEQINFGRKRKTKGIQTEPSVFSETEHKIGDEKLGKKIKHLGEHKSYKAMEGNASILSSCLSKMKSRIHKEKNEEFLLHSKRLIHEAIISGFIPQKIFYTRASDLTNLNLPEETKLFRVPYKACQLWADTVTSQGIIGIFKIPKTMKTRTDCIPLTVICDNIRDPGNMGAILRIVSAVGCEKLILTQGCTGIWEQKVLRAGAGAHFHLPILKSMVWTDIENEISESSEVFLADCHDELDSTREDSIFTKLNENSKLLPKSSYFSIQFEKKSTVFVIGGETHGLSDEAFAFALRRNGTRVFIPISNNIESLNNSVALGILAFEFKRQFISASEKVSNSLMEHHPQSAELRSEIS